MEERTCLVSSGATWLAMVDGSNRASQERPLRHKDLEDEDEPVAALLRVDYFTSAISNSIFSSSFTFTVPPATFTGVIPNSVCLKVADPR